MNPEIAQIKKEIEALNKRLDQFNNSTTIPLPVAEAFRARLLGFGASAKTAGSETQTVAENGIDTYDVAKPMDGFLDIGLGRAIPYWLINS